MTRIFQVAPLAWSGNLLRAAYELLAERVFARLDPEGTGIVVAAASPNTGEAVGGVAAILGRGRPWSGIVGRHGATSLRLPSDGALSLRHAILVARVADDGCPILRAIDLRSGVGMFDADGAPHLSVVANGPLRLRVGNSALFAIPACDLLRGGRAAAYGEIDWPAPSRWLPDAAPETRVADESRATSRSSVVSLEPRRVRRLGSGAGGRIAGTLVVEIDGRRADLAVDAAALRAGVLLGRYPRCDVNCGNAPMSLGVSRVHALFLALGERAHVFDAGSSNGVRCGGRDADGLCLPEDRPTRLALFGDDAITWLPGCGSLP
jgi:hypothetical protein